jgi:hypothetical protein
MNLETKRPKLLIRIGFLAVVLSGLVVGVWASRTEKLKPMGTPVQFDDFRFSVVNARTIAAGDSESEKYVVSLKVSNLAKRVSYNFDQQSALLILSNGILYRPERTPEISKDSCATPLLAGTSCETELVYIVPKGTRGARLRLSFGAIGDFLERLLFGHVAIQLP